MSNLDAVLQKLNEGDVKTEILNLWSRNIDMSDIVKITGKSEEQIKKILKAAGKRGLDEAFAIKLKSGKLAKSSSAGTPLWFSDKKDAEKAVVSNYGSDAEVIEVKLKKDPYAYNGSNVVI